MTTNLDPRQGRPLLKRLVYVTAALALLLLVGAVGVTAWYVFRFDLGSVSVPIEHQLTKLLGREVKLGGIRKGAGVLRPHIEVEELVVLADPVTRSELARIDQALIGLDLLPLLRRTLRIDSIALRGVRVSLGTDAEGKPMWPLHLASEASGGGHDMHVQLEEVDLHQGDVRYHDGEHGGTTRALIDTLALKIHASGRLDLSLQGEVENLAIQLEGHVVPPSDAGSKAPQQIALEGKVGDVSLRASGTVEDVLALAGLDLALEAHAPRLPLPDDWGEKLSLEGVEASARLTDSDGIARLEDVKLEVGSGPKRLQLTGHVNDLFGERRSALDATLDLPSLRTLSPLVEVDLPDLGPVHGTMNLREAGDKVHVEGIDLAVGGDAGPRVHVQGTISDVRGLVGLDLRATAEAPDLRGLVAGLDPRLQELGPLRVETRAVGAGSTVQLREIDVQLGRGDDLWASAQGQVDAVAGAHHVKLELRAGAPGTRRLAALLGRELPELSPVAAKAGLRGTLKRLRLERGELRLGRREETLLVLKGASLQLPPGDSFELDAELSARDLRALGELFESELPPKGPVRASATLRVTPEHIALHHVEAEIHRTKLTGAAASTLDAKGRRQLTATLASPELHVDDLTPEPGTDDGGEGPSFRERRLPVELLRAQDAELVLQFDRVLGRGALDLQDLKLRLVLERGRLSIDPFSFQLRAGERGGPVEAQAGVDASGSEPSWWLRAQSKHLHLTSLTAQFTTDEPVKGMGLMSADLTSHGESGQEVLEGLDGDFTLALRDSVLHGDFVLLLRKDLVTALALERRREPTTGARCALAPFQITGGVAKTETLLLDSHDVLLHGKGTIDLVQERFDLVLTPKAKRPGIGLMEPVALGGSFQKPKVRPVKMALAKDAAKAFLGTLVVPGLGTIAPFLHVGTFGRDPCAKALAIYLEAK